MYKKRFCHIITLL